MATANATAPLAAAGPVGGEPVSRRVLHDLASRLSPAFAELAKGTGRLNDLLKKNNEELMTVMGNYPEVFGLKIQTDDKFRLDLKNWDEERMNQAQEPPVLMRVINEWGAIQHRANQGSELRRSFRTTRKK